MKNNEGKSVLLLIPYWLYSLKTLWLNFISFLKKKYFKLTNKTQRDALRILNYSYSEDKIRICPVCKDFATSNSFVMSDHISDVHGFPKDMEVAEYVKDDTIKPPVEKANSDYLKYL